jgi:sigma-B regulation protein RsbU (phosphoserine phosphatase)
MMRGSDPMTRTSEGDRYRILFEHSSDAHFIFDETGITDCNDATIRLLRANGRSHVLALHPAVLSPKFQPDGRLSIDKAKEMDATARERGYHRFEWMHRKLDGEVFPVEVTLNPVELGGSPAMIVVWHDLTEIKRAEAELRLRGQELESANRDLAAVNNRMTRDLEAAARVQKALLPTLLPQLDSVQFAWAFRPCDELAGDILNIFQLDASHIGFYVLDVSGHGVSAALLSVAVSHFLSPLGPNSLLRWPDGRLARPSEVLERLNGQFSGEHSEQFSTLFYGVLELGTFEVSYANAGHPSPVVISEGGILKTMHNSSFPIGIFDEATYDDDVVRLQPGDRLWLYSDGVVEAMNDDGVQFGNDRFEAELRLANSIPIDDAVERLLQVVKDWAGPNGPQDDISIIAIGIDAV